MPPSRVVVPGNHRCPWCELPREAARVAAFFPLPRRALRGGPHSYGRSERAAPAETTPGAATAPAQVLRQGPSWEATAAANAHRALCLAGCGPQGLAVSDTHLCWPSNKATTLLLQCALWPPGASPGILLRGGKASRRSRLSRSTRSAPLFQGS